MGDTEDNQQALSSCPKEATPLRHQKEVETRKPCWGWPSPASGPRRLSSCLNRCPSNSRTHYHELLPSVSHVILSWFTHGLLFIPLLAYKHSWTMLQPKILEHQLLRTSLHTVFSQVRVKILMTAACEQKLWSVYSVEQEATIRKSNTLDRLLMAPTCRTEISLGL